MTAGTQKLLIYLGVALGLLAFLVAIWLSRQTSTEVHLAGKPLPPPPIEYPESILEKTWVRPFNMASSAWVPANKADTETPGVYEIRVEGDHSLDQKQSLEIIRKAKQTAEKNGWASFEQGISDGFFLQHDIDPLHYIKAEHMGDGETLNPEKPEALMYYPTPDGMVLAGVMFLADSVSQVPPQLATDNAYWHFHRWNSVICWENGLPAEPNRNGNCPPGAEVSDQSPLMLHVWFVDHPEGPFATEMCLPDGVLESISGTDSLKKAMSLRPLLEKLQRQSQDEARETIRQQLTQ